MIYYVDDFFFLQLLLYYLLLIIIGKNNYLLFKPSCDREVMKDGECLLCWSSISTEIEGCNHVLDFLVSYNHEVLFNFQHLGPSIET